MTITQLTACLSDVIKENSIVTTGVASPIPLLAITYAQRSKEFTYLNCTGAIDPIIGESKFSSVSRSILEKNNSFLKLEKIWDYANRGIIDMMFFGASQVDPEGNTNMSFIGSPKDPKVKLPGPAAAVTLRKVVKDSILVVPKHSKRVFVEKLDFLSSPNTKICRVITNLCIFELSKKRKPRLISIHPGHNLEEVEENTGFDFDTKDYKTTNISEKSIEEIKKLDNNNVLKTLYGN